MKNEQQKKNPILEAKNISKSFGGVQALVDASFNLFSSEILAIVGANGAGKSTLMKIVAGVYPPDSGEIIIDGKHYEKIDIHSVREQGVEMVYQDLALVKNMDAPYNLFMGKVPRKYYFFVDEKKMVTKTKEIFNLLNIETVQDIAVPVDGFSGGQQQALAIGRAVLWGKKIIILDEPTAALGVKESEKVMELIIELRNKGIAVIVISHNLDHVFKLSDRILVVRQGYTVAEVKRSEVTIDDLVKVITSGSF